MTALPSYSTGTVSIAANGTVVTGTGSNWTGQNAMAGDTLSVTGFGQVKINDVTDATHLVIDAWPFAAVPAGTSYSIKKDSLNRIQGIQTAQAVDELVSDLQANGFYVFVGPTATAPDPSLGQDNQYALQASTGKQWEKVGGIWNFVGTFKGINPRGAYDHAATYSQNDVTEDDGSAYLYIGATPSAGNDPPNATFWMLLAGKGVDGAPGAKGDKGDAATISAGTVTTLAAGSAATVVNVGTESAAVFNFGIPKGADGTGTGDMKGANNLSDVANPATALANLGGLAKSANLSDVTTPATALANIGGLAKSANLSDVANAATARSNLGINQSVALPASCNFNTIVATGSYYTVDAASTNVPLSSAQFYLDVEADNASNVRQIAMQKGTGAIWVRVFSSSAWAAWTPLGGSSSFATKADQQAGTSGTLAVSPAHQQDHASSAKAWGYVTYSGGTPTLQAGYNISSITSGGTGVITWHFTTSFASTNFACLIGARPSATNPQSDSVTARTVSSVTTTHFEGGTASATNPVDIEIVCFGTQ